MDSRGVYSLQPNTIQHYDKRVKAGDLRPTMVGVGEKGESWRNEKGKGEGFLRQRTRLRLFPLCIRLTE